MTYTLVLLRHGESDWNAKNLFTGWVDVDLSDKGRAEAVRGGELMVAEAAAAGRRPHLGAAARDPHREPRARRGRPALDPGASRTGGSTSATTAPAGQGQEADAGAVRRGAVHALAPLLRHPAAADLEPTTSTRQAGDPRYAGLGADMPRTECLKDVVARMLPYWEDEIVPDLRDGQAVLVAAHGNSLRALVKHLDGDQRRRHRRRSTSRPASRWSTSSTTTSGRSRPAVATSTRKRPPRPPRRWPTRAAERLDPLTSATRESSCSSWSSSGRSSSLRYSPVTR